MNKQEIKKRLKIACIKSNISRWQFVMKYYGAIIPLSKNGWAGAYQSISNMLTPNSRDYVQDWLIKAIEAEEKEHENTTH